MVMKQNVRTNKVEITRGTKTHRLFNRGADGINYDFFGRLRGHKEREGVDCGERGGTACKSTVKIKNKGMARVHLHVYGKVQDVNYRSSTETQATKLGLTGWVRNREDGSVECVAEGKGKA